MRAIQIAPNIYWVGAVDWELRYFHGYDTERGSTYNAFLVTGPEPVLVDTVKAPFWNEMMARIRSVLDPSEIQYVVSNHAEMDHSGGLAKTVHTVRPKAVFASKMGVQALAAQLHWDQEVQAVADGQVIELGGRPFQFFETRMVHWPDSMFTYLPKDKVLFSQDAFGMHLATEDLFADHIDPAVLRWEAAKYYANIVMPFSEIVARLLDRVRDAGLDIQILAPDHGPLWRGEGIQEVLGWYGQWSHRLVRPKAVVLYDTMWKSTAAMATAIADGITLEGVECVVLPLSGTNRATAATHALDAAALVVGSPTLNRNIFPTVADVLTYLKGLRPPARFGAVFGSYGWSGESVGLLRKELEAMKLPVLEQEMKIRYVPTEEDLAACRRFGREIAEEVRKRLGEKE